tara:strand:+ start:453 stop:617 length:165 start_codon:yes stop_codon:yes gene_type:complete
MKFILNFLKTYFQWDFIKAYFVGMKYFVIKRKATINYPFEKGKNYHQDLGVNML